MSPRLVGAVLALIAAILLAASVATSALWAGHPSVDGRPIEKKTVYVGHLGGEGCNTGGDGKCEDLQISTAFSMVALAELGTSALLLLVALGLGLTGFKKSESRKTLGKVTIGVALLCAVVAGVMIVIGPNIKSSHTVTVPIGYGMYLFFGAIAGALLAGFLTPKEDPPVRLRPSRQPTPQPLAVVSAPIDVLALLQAEDPRPAPPSPGGLLPGPGPLGFGTGPAFDNNGLPPPPSSSRPFSIPAPPPSRPVAIPTPPPMMIPERAETSQDPIAPPPAPFVPPPPATRTKAASVVPPPRAKAPSIPPPNKPLPAPGFSLKRPTTLSAAVPPPAPNPPAIPPGSPMLPFRADTDTSDLAATHAIHQEPDLMVGTPISVGDSTDANVLLPPEERTDLNAALVDDNAETKARVKEDPDDLETNEQSRASAKSMPKIPVSTAPESLPPPKDEKAAAGPQPACPQCEAPMSWVEEHLRFYCKSCRMYF